MARVLVADPIDELGVARLVGAGHQVDVRKGLSEDELCAIVGDYEAMVVRSETKVTPGVLAAYSTVGQLDRYLRVAMPHEAPGSLPDNEYDAILRYLIESRGMVPGGGNAWPLPDSTRLGSSAGPSDG